LPDPWYEDSAVSAGWAKTDDTFGHETARVVPVALTKKEAATVDPHHHRQEMRESLVGLWRREHVEIQTVLGQAGDPVRTGTLWAVICESRRVEHAVPARGLLRRAPAEIADGRRRVWDAAEDLHTVDRKATNRSVISRHGRKSRRGGGDRNRCEERRHEGRDEKAWLVHASSLPIR